MEGLYLGKSCALDISSVEDGARRRFASFWVNSLVEASEALFAVHYTVHSMAKLPLRHAGQ